MNKKSAVFLLLFILIWLLAPRYHMWMGHPDESAWVQLFTLPTGLIGIVLCIANISKKGSRKIINVLTIFTYIVFVGHLLIASGMHPR